MELAEEVEDAVVDDYADIQTGDNQQLSVVAVYGTLSGRRFWLFKVVSIFMKEIRLK